MRILAPLPFLLLAACKADSGANRDSRGAATDSAQVGRAPAASSSLRDSVRAQLMQADRDFARATATRGVEGWLAYFEPDGAQVNGGGSVASGLPAIRELMTPTLSDPEVRLTWAPTDAMVTDQGRLGSTAGRWELVRRDSTGATKVAARGSYLTVWRRQPDGSWKIVSDVGSPD